MRRLVFCVGSGGTTDFGNIQTLIGEPGGGGPDGLLYKNFKALLTAIPAIDAIDFDDEDLMDVDTTVAFAKLLGSLGTKVTFCPYIDPYGYWVPCLKQLEADDPGLVTRFNLQCYDGGGDNTPLEWMEAITDELGPTFDVKGFVAPGLWCTNEAKPEWGHTPGAVRDQIASWRSDSGIEGGWIWLLDDILKCQLPGEATGTADYAGAVLKGLEGDTG